MTYCIIPATRKITNEFYFATLTRTREFQYSRIRIETLGIHECARVWQILRASLPVLCSQKLADTKITENWTERMRRKNEMEEWRLPIKIRGKLFRNWSCHYFPGEAACIQLSMLSFPSYLSLRFGILFHTEINIFKPMLHLENSDSSSKEK